MTNKKTTSTRTIFFPEWSASAAREGRKKEWPSGSRCQTPSLRQYGFDHRNYCNRLTFLHPQPPFPPSHSLLLLLFPKRRVRWQKVKRKKDRQQRHCATKDTLMLLTMISPSRLCFTLNGWSIKTIMSVSLSLSL